MPNQTKADLIATVEAYREENTKLHAKLEAHGTPYNMCDSVTEFFTSCTSFVAEQTERALSLVR